jgi:hypothetical protein
MRITIMVSVDVPWALELAAGWCAAGEDVTLVLLDGAVAAARTGHLHAGGLGELLAAGGAVLAEEQALARRSLDSGRAVPGVKSTDLDQVADLLLDGSDRVVWL